MTPQEKGLLGTSLILRLAWTLFIIYVSYRVIHALDLIAAGVSR